MNRFGIYLAKETYLAILIALLAFLSLFMFFDMLQELGDVGEGSYSFPLAFLYVLLISLGRIYELLPIAVLIGALYTLSRFAARSEFTVIRASGLSTANALAMVLKIGVPLVIGTFIFGEVLAPFADDTARRLKATATDTVINSKYALKSGFWTRDGRFIVNVGRILSDNRIENMLLYEFDEDFSIKSIHKAKTGVFVRGEGWHLEDVNYTRFEKNRVNAGHEDRYIWASGLDATILSISTVNPERMTAQDLFDYSRRLSENRENNERYQVAFWKKITYPFTCLVMMIIALPMAYNQQRAQRTSLNLFIGIMIGVIFYVLNAISSSLGVLNNWPAPLIALFPALLFLLLGCVMLWKADRR